MLPATFGGPAEELPHQQREYPQTDAGATTGGREGIERARDSVVASCYRRASETAQRCTSHQQNHDSTESPRGGRLGPGGAPDMAVIL